MTDPVLAKWQRVLASDCGSDGMISIDLEELRRLVEMAAERDAIMAEYSEYRESVEETP